MERLIIGFCGGTGSGKTTLAKRVIDAVGGDGVLVSMDCYYTDHREMPFEERAKINYDHPNAFDTDLLISHLKDLKAGKRATPTIAVDCGECTHIDCDAVVLSLGVRSVNGLAKALEGKYDGRVFTIGDAVKSGRIADATAGAYQVASTLK